MDFARKQLLKYGWSDGKGLGKNENGISEALKPKLKRSVTGVGYDVASDFTEHWWSELYNKAAGNVEVKEKNGKTKKIKTKESDNFEITTSMWRLSKGKQNKEGAYSEHFVRKSILTNGGSKVENVTESESDGETEKKDVFKMTDEELFAACEGRTAHKGARHGLKALGKLARIAQQEQMLLSQSRFDGYFHAEKLKRDISVNDLQVVEDMNLNSDVETTFVKKKKKKRKRCISQNSASDITEKSICINGYSHEEKLKQDIPVNVLQVVEDMNLDGDVLADAKKKKKKLKRCFSPTSALDITAKNICINGYSHEEKLKQGIPVKVLQFVDDMNLNSVVADVKKKKKKRKRCVSQNSVLDNTVKNICNSEELPEYPVLEVNEKKLEIGVICDDQLKMTSRISKKSKSESVVNNDLCFLNDCKSKKNKKRKDYDDDYVKVISVDKHEIVDESDIVKKTKKKKTKAVE